MASYLQIEKAGKVATVRLNRPDKHNAFDEHLIAELTQAFRDLASDAAVRVVALAANGESFSAGADLDWMKRMSAMGRADNERDAMALADLMEAIDRCPKPVVGVIQGAAFGGGVGRQIAERLRQLRDQVLVERVVLARPVQPHRRNLVRPLDLEIRGHRSSHPENAEPGALDRRVERGG